MRRHGGFLLIDVSFACALFVLVALPILAGIYSVHARELGRRARVGRIAALELAVGDLSIDLEARPPRCDLPPEAGEASCEIIVVKGIAWIVIEARYADELLAVRWPVADSPSPR